MKTRKPSKVTIDNTREIEAKGGAILASDWTSGSGRFIRKRNLPCFCSELPADQIDSLKGRSRANAKRLLKRHPRARKIIVITDWRGFNKVKGL